MTYPNDLVSVKFNPQPDITIHELAVILTSFMELQIPQNRLDSLKEVERHLQVSRPVTAGTQAESSTTPS